VRYIFFSRYVRKIYKLGFTSLFKMNDLVRSDYNVSTRGILSQSIGPYLPISIRGMILRWYEHFTEVIGDPEINSRISDITGDGFDAIDRFAQKYLEPFNKDYPKLQEAAQAIERGGRRRDVFTADLAMAVMRLSFGEVKLRDKLGLND
jgi:hypothetical protein